MRHPVEPEIQNVFRNKIGFSSEGFEILEAVEEKEHPTPSTPPKKMKMAAKTVGTNSIMEHHRLWNSIGDIPAGEFDAIEEKVGFTSEQIQAIALTHASTCKVNHHHLAKASCNFATGVENNIRIAK